MLPLSCERIKIFKFNDVLVDASSVFHSRLAPRPQILEMLMQSQSVDGTGRLASI